MNALITQLFNDEAGFVVSAELVLITTIAVLALVVGLSELSSAINQELEDVATAFGSVNQSYSYSGTCGDFGQSAGSAFNDQVDFCDNESDIVPVNAVNEN